MKHNKICDTQQQMSETEKKRIKENDGVYLGEEDIKDILIEFKQSCQGRRDDEASFPVSSDIWIFIGCNPETRTRNKVSVSASRGAGKKKVFHELEVFVEIDSDFAAVKTSLHKACDGLTAWLKRICFESTKKPK